MNTAAAGSPIMIDGYVRLSRDDNKRNYSSIENQKKIIRQFAEENNMVVRRIYEDDGISGYSFDRPEFQRMMADLDTIQVIAAKDLSRIGRHNAKVLLFLEKMEEMGKRVILIDDHYDSFCSDDDIIGIKTWDNERHVKNTSRKVKRIKRMEQENGTLISRPPFGYMRHPVNKQLILIDEEAAAILHLEKDLYLEGNGIRKTAEILTAQNIPTPSMLEKERYEALGLVYNKQVACRWSFGMVRDTLFNDYNNGVLRTHKRERITINGKDKKIPEEQQFIFPDHHPKIFDDETMKRLYDTKESRHHSSYRGQRVHVNLFSGCLYCQNCKARLTAINRPGRQKYYVCGTYNKKGKQFCSAAHMVKESTLTDSLIQYLAISLDDMKSVLESFNPADWTAPAFSHQDSLQKLKQDMEREKEELKILVKQKIKEIASDPAMSEIISETYDGLQKEKAERIRKIGQAIENLTANAPAPLPDTDSGLKTGWNLMNELIASKALTRMDIEILVQKIIVDQDGNVDIYLKYGC